MKSYFYVRYSLILIWALMPILLNSQNSWETTLAAIDDSFTIGFSDLSEDDNYLYAYAGTEYVVVDKNQGNTILRGEKESWFREESYDRFRYLFTLENDSTVVWRLDALNGNVDSIMAYTDINFPSISQVEIINENLFAFINFTIGSNSGRLMVVQSDGEILHSRTIIRPSWFEYQDNKLYLGLGESVRIYDIELSLVGSTEIENEIDGFIYSEFTVDKAGNIFYALNSFSEDNFILGRLNEDLNVESQVAVPKIDFAFIDAILTISANNGKLSILLGEFEVYNHLRSHCYDYDLTLINEIQLDTTDLWFGTRPNTIANAEGGFYHLYQIVNDSIQSLHSEDYISTLVNTGQGCLEEPSGDFFSCRMYDDVNLNSVFDDVDTYINDTRLFHTNKMSYIYPDLNGKFYFSLNEGTNTFLFDVDNCFDSNTSWTVDSDTISPNSCIEYPVSKNSFDSLGINISLISECSNLTTMNVNISNEGCSRHEGVLTVTGNDLVNILSSDEKEVRLLSGEAEQISFVILTEDGPSDGNDLDINLNFESFEGNSILDTTYTRIINCPTLQTEIQVLETFTENQYGLFDQPLIYSIEFTNISDGPLSPFSIIDTIPDLLDISSLVFVSSSSEVIVDVQDNIITWTFVAGLLETNDVGSLEYQLSPLEIDPELNDTIRIANTVYFHFEVGPSVATNSTEVVLVETFDNDEDTFNFWEDCDDNNVEINPLAIDIPGNGIDEDCSGFDSFIILSLNNELLSGLYDSHTGKINLTWEIENEDDYQLYEFQNYASVFGTFEKLQPNNSGKYLAEYTPDRDDMLFRVKLTDFDDNVSYSDIIQVSVLGSLINEVSIKPNPATDFILVEMSYKCRNITSLIIRDLDGKIVLTEELKEENTSIAVNNFARGLYFVQVTNGQDFWTQKLLID